MNGRPPAQGLSNGARLVLAFLALTYVLPAAAYLVMDPEERFACPKDRIDVWVHMAIAVSSIAAGAVFAGRARRCVESPHPRGFPTFVAAAAAVAVAVNAPALLSGVSLRYGSVSLSDQMADGQGVMAIAVIVLQTLAPLLAWWVFLRRGDLWTSCAASAVALRWTLAAATVTGINGLSSAARAAVVLAMIAWPKLGFRVLFAGPSAPRQRRGLLLALVGFAAAAVVLAAIGLRAKTGSTGTAEDWDRYTEPGYLVGRNSTHFQHGMAALEVGIDEGDRTAEFSDRAAIAIDDARYRMGVLTGNPSWGSRPDPASLSRYTFERFALFEPSERMARSGSSPSVIGGFALSFPPPWSFAAMAAFTFVLVRWLDWLLADTPRLGWLGCAIIAFGPLRILTDTPTNLLNPFGTPFIVVALATAARLLLSYAVASPPATAHERTN